MRISAYISHISDRPNYLQTAPTAMIPVGALSMLIINIMFMPQFNYIGIFYVPPGSIPFQPPSSTEYLLPPDRV